MPVGVEVFMYILIGREEVSSYGNSSDGRRARNFARLGRLFNLKRRLDFPGESRLPQKKIEDSFILCTTMMKRYGDNTYYSSPRRGCTKTLVLGLDWFRRVPQKPKRKWLGSCAETGDWYEYQKYISRKGFLGKKRIWKQPTY